MWVLLIPLYCKRNFLPLSVQLKFNLAEVTSHPGSLGGKPCVRVREGSQDRAGQVAALVTPRVLAVKGRVPQPLAPRSPNLPFPGSWELPGVAQSTTLSLAPECAGLTRGVGAGPNLQEEGGPTVARDARRGRSEGTGSRAAARLRTGQPRRVWLV